MHRFKLTVNCTGVIEHVVCALFVALFPFLYSPNCLLIFRHIVFLPCFFVYVQPSDAIRLQLLSDLDYK